MATLCSSYVNASVARSGVEALRAAGVPGRDIHLLIGRPAHDTRRERGGGFAGPVAPDAPVGTFGNTRRLRRQGTGTFAGDADGQRQGSFADTNPDVIVTHEGAAARAHVVGDRGLRRLLSEAALDDDASDRVVDELHAGHVVVLAEVAEITPSKARERLAAVA
ncbi:MAG: hypothetical protein ABI611_11390 [Solirubrobacteraceae bacterium]